MIVDPHTHTHPTSACSMMSAEELVDSALALGLDAVAVTDHGTIEGAEYAREVGRLAGLAVFRGLEVHTREGDLLVFGVREDPEPLHAAADLIEWVRERGGVCVAAHPFRGGLGLGARHGHRPAPDDLLEKADAVETHNGGDGEEARMLAEAAARRLGRPTFGGSDAHRPGDVGRCVTVFARRLACEADFVTELRAGRCRGVASADLPAGGETLAST